MKNLLIIILLTFLFLGAFQSLEREIFSILNTENKVMFKIMAVIVTAIVTNFIVVSDNKEN